MRLLIGGYTKTSSKGIYEMSLKAEDNSAKISDIHNIIQVNGPTYFQKDKEIIFSIDKPNIEEGGISSFTKIDGEYQKIDSILSPGSSPAYLGINKHKRYLYTANYHTGVISVIAYNEKGSLSTVASLTHTSETLGPRPEQMDGAHPHFFDETPAGNLVCCDLGNDTVTFYRLTEQNELVELAKYKNEPGFGDRHLVFSKDGNYFYVVGELSSKVNVVKFNEETWDFENIATYSTIPEYWDKHNGAAAIRISNDGRHLYVSNRGNDTIVVFEAQADHTLKLIQRISTFGKFPRDFNWDKNEQFVVAANQNSNNATLYTRNPKTGALTPIQKDIQVPEGTCVLFE